MIHQVFGRTRFSSLKNVIFIFGVATVGATVGASVAKGSSELYRDLEFDTAVPVKVREQLLGDLDMLKDLTGTRASVYYQRIFGASILAGTDLVEFLKNRIRLVALSECGGNGLVVACVMPNIDSSVMWLTKNYLTFNIPQIMRISIILHESRHTEVANDNWAHAKCPDPFLDENGKDMKGIFSGAKLAGHRACDVTALGSYGLQAVFLKNVELHCESCTEKVRMDARLFGNDTLTRITQPRAAESLKDDLK